MGSGSSSLAALQVDSTNSTVQIPLFMTLDNSVQPYLLQNSAIVSASVTGDWCIAVVNQTLLSVEVAPSQFVSYGPWLPSAVGVDLSVLYVNEPYTLAWRGPIAVSAAAVQVTILSNTQAVLGSLPLENIENIPYHQGIVTIPASLASAVTSLSASFSLQLTAYTSGGVVVGTAESNSFQLSSTFSMIVGQFGACIPDSSECGVGVQQRAVECLRLSLPSLNQSDAPIDYCISNGLVPPTLKQPCYLPCSNTSGTHGVLWLTSDWTSCSASCGTDGVQTRTISCVSSTSGDKLDGSVCLQAALDVPDSVQPCNRKNCTYSVTVGDWGSCIVGNTFDWIEHTTAQCGSGTRYRSIGCVNEFGEVVPAQLCSAAVSQLPTEENCDLVSCSSPHYVVSEWSQCSQPCQSGTGLLQTNGVQTRTVNCVVVLGANSTLVPTSECGTPLASVSPCNRVPCPSNSFSVVTGPWSPCTPSAACGATFGTQTRSVLCIQSSSSVNVVAALLQGSGNISELSQISVPPFLCNSGNGLPSATESCIVSAVTPCHCNSSSDCTLPNTVCSATSGTCVCSSGFTGPSCTVEAGRTSASGCVVDGSGQCCFGAIGSNGLCCGNGTVLDVNGRCCTGLLDACGVCNGGGIVVDMEGNCCSTPLPPSGLCCSSGYVDDCGVCGGSNACGINVQFSVSIGSNTSLVRTAACCLFT